ncbi:hypothetical protein DZC71_07540, partial [Campylobacter hepaticus]
HVGDIDNQGYIRDVYIGIWKENHATLTLDSFKNSGLIYNTSDNGILFEGKDVVIDKFINEKIIASNDSTKAGLVIGQANDRNDNITIKLLLNKGLIGGEHSKYGILISGDNTGNNPDNFKIDHLINTGVIYGEDEAIFLNRSTLTNFLNTGTIKANNNRGIETATQTKIENFINSGSIIIDSTSNHEAIKFLYSSINNFLNTGTIQATGSRQIAGVLLRGSTINHILNTGMIEGNAAIAVYSSKVTNLINTGTIKSTLNNNDAHGAISIGTVNGNQVTVSNLINTGTIDSMYNGISMEVGSTLTNLYNNGTIKAQKYGITFYSNGGSGDKAQVDAIIIGKNSDIQATENAINVDVIGSNSTIAKPVSVDLIDIQEGAKVHGNKAGINIGKTNNTNGTKTVGQIIVAGEIQGGSEGGIVNEGTVKASENKSSNESKSRTRRSLSDEENKAAIIVEKTGSITSSNGNKGIINKDKGKIEGDIISKSSSEISLENQGSVKGNISNSGSGSLMIENKNNNGSNSASITGSITNSGLGTLDLMNNASITGNISNTGNGSLMFKNSSTLTGSITNSGSGSLMIENKNNNGSTNATISGSIMNQGDGNLILDNTGSITKGITNSGNGNLSLTNQENATISGGITNSGSGTLMLNNSGSIGMNDSGYNISNEGDGSVNITSWTIRTDDTTKSLQTLTVGGRSANSVMVENLIVDQSGLNMDELNDINNLVSGVSLNNIKKINTNGSGEMILSYDALSGKISTDFNLNASIIGASFRALNASSIKR